MYKVVALAGDNKVFFGINPERLVWRETIAPAYPKLEAELILERFKNRPPVKGLNNFHLVEVVWA